MMLLASHALTASTQSEPAIDTPCEPSRMRPTIAEAS